MDTFTAKQQAFIDGRIAGMSGSAAARNAGYSPNGVTVAATNMMKVPKIKRAIAAGIKSHKKGKKENAPEVRLNLGRPQQAMQRAHYADPKDFLIDAMNNETLPVMARKEAAKELMPYMHSRIGEKGKKENAKDRANETGQGKYKSKAPPPADNVVKLRA